MPGNEWDTDEVRIAREALQSIPSMAVADLNLRRARNYGRGKARERRIDAALADIAAIHRATALGIEELVRARRNSRRERPLRRAGGP